MIRRFIARYCRKQADSWRNIAATEAACQALAIMGGDELGQREFAGFYVRSKRAAEKWERWAARLET